MLKFGVFALEDYRPERGRLISLRLLRTALPPEAREVDAFEAITRNLRLSSGIFRTTFHGRFQDLDPVVNRILLERFAPEAPLGVHDWAASDCLTSAEWASSLFNAFPNASLYASDLNLFLVEITFPEGDVLITERDGEPIQYISRRFIVNWNIPEWRPRTLCRFLKRRGLARLARVQVNTTWLDAAEELVVGPFSLRRISMNHPAAEAFRSRDQRFTIARHSAFEILPQPVDVIRTMNIYNLSYFSKEKLVRGARTVWSSIKPGGVWIVGRTWREEPPASNVSIFERTDTGFELLHRSGDGSEIESLVLEPVLEHDQVP
jgi:hypothetical protein